MIARLTQSLFADPHGAAAIIRRLLSEQAYQHRWRYVMAFALMGVAAACTAATAYLLGDVVNQAYVHKNFHALVAVGVGAFGLFALQFHFRTARFPKGAPRMPAVSSPYAS